ncbi:MAG: DUF4433 domain-containing protein [Pseudomonadales bacterium]|nr:DUF4433 domain-containing protein [Pseudomonadales bacterium]
MSNNYPNLNPEKALIWRIVHRENIGWILDNDLHSANSGVVASHYEVIGNRDLISRRLHRQVPVAPGGVLGDYVPFYFTPFSPMMYNIYTGRGEVTRRGNEEIVILVCSLRKINDLGIPFVFTDRHAYTPLAEFYNDVGDLHKVDWPLLQQRNFQRNSDDPVQIERYQAEALIHQHCPVKGLLGIVCYTDAVKLELEQEISQRGLNLDVHKLTQWYF